MSVHETKTTSALLRMVENRPDTQAWLEIKDEIFLIATGLSMLLALANDDMCEAYGVDCVVSAYSEMVTEWLHRPATAADVPEAMA